MRRSLAWFVPVLCLACGGSNAGTGGGSNGGGGSGGGAMGTGGAGGMMAGGIPDPGTSDQVDQDFTNVEPNDTPQQATPLGVAMSGSVAVWVGGNTIGGSDNPADYFVFKSGPAPGAFSFDVCFGPPITDMTATLWKVVGGAQQTPPIGTWASSGTCVTNSGMGAPLEASTDYLFGLTANGGVGTYGA